MPWGDWKKLYPNTLVLSTDTGFNRPYGIDPYAGYYRSPEILFPLSHSLPTFPPKTTVLGLSISNVNKSYPLNLFNQSGIFEDTIGNQSVVFFIGGQGLVRSFNPVLGGRSLNFVYSNGTFTDVQTRSVWNYDGVAISGQLEGKVLTRFVTITAFWFAWVAFYSNTLVYLQKQ